MLATVPWRRRVMTVTSFALAVIVLIGTWLLNAARRFGACNPQAGGLDHGPTRASYLVITSSDSRPPPTAPYCVGNHNPPDIPD